MIEIHLSQVLISTGVGPNGTKVLVADDAKSGIRVLIPMDEQSARAIAAALSSGLLVTSKVPGNGSGGGSG